MTKTLKKLNRSQALSLAQSVNNIEAFKFNLKLHLNRLGKPKNGNHSTWQAVFSALLAFVENDLKEPPFSIFTKGNSKLPFFSFSSLPLVDCPGMGACQSFCYSLSAWQYPAALARMLQNSLLLRYNRQAIKSAFMQLPENRVLRLYVDGDFYNKDILVFWLNLCKERKDLDIYGYSKSWQLFLDLHKENFAWPENYSLNLSSGSRYSEEKRKAMEKLPVTRGNFIALQTEKRFIREGIYKSKRIKGFAEYQNDLRERAKKLGMQKTFVCAGKCGDCLPNGKHACGSSKMKNVNIVIGVH